MRDAARDPVLSVRDLRVELPAARGRAVVLDGVSLDVRRGECVAIVGESGCGKTTLARACMGLLPRGGRIAGGSIALDGADLARLGERELCAVRGAAIAWIPQEPASALDPVMRVGAQVAEALEVHGLARGAGAQARALDAMARVGLPNAERLLREVPHRLSGGMRQRVAIAAALAAGPKVLLADEPTTALDAMLRAQVFARLRALRAETGLAVVLISHDLATVGREADRIVVLYAGRVVEEGPAARVLDAPLHPYTRALVACAPRAGALPLPIPGRPPATGERVAGCRFHPRCALREAACERDDPALAADPREPARRAACPVVLRRPS